MFGSAFLLIELSLKSFSPILIAFLRVTLAAIILFLYSVLKNYNFHFVCKNFLILFILAMSGTSVPFVLISWAQTIISSSETAILIGFMPLFTIIGSHFFFKYENISLNKVIGFVLGFSSLCILLFDNVVNANPMHYVMPKLAVIFGAFFYALNALLVKKIKNIDPIPLSASVMIISSIQLFFLLVLRFNFEDFNIIYEKESFFALLIMGIFSTGFATVIYYKVIQSYGPNFLSLVNYPIPVFAFFLGVFFLNESTNINAIVSLFLVIISIYVSQKK